MSIKEFVDKGNVRKRFGNTLPNPYMESIEIGNNLITVQLAVYMHIPESEWAYDQGGEFIEETVGGVEPLHTWCMILVDRNSNTSAYATQQQPLDDATGTNEYGSMHPDAYSRVVEGRDSPLRYCRFPDGLGDDWAKLEYAPKFTMPTWADHIDAIKGAMYSDATTAASFLNYQWSNQSDATLTNLTHLVSESAEAEDTVVSREILTVMSQMISDLDPCIPRLMEHFLGLADSYEYVAFGKNTFYGGMLSDYTMSE